ncbi:MAG TPA: cytochrome c-type biogenesis protein CcmH [Capillimicrobium sp.]|nr:cytochrome c-type biogenesis protein CcmH [Capillimicrobium sp.]
MRLRLRLRTLLLAAVAALAIAAAPQAVAATPQTSLSDIEDEVMCPVCGVALNIAESPQADDERALIRDLVAKGLTKEEIKQRLVAEYGQAVLAEPDDEGFDLAAWVVPAAVVAVLIAAGALLLPRWRRRARAAADGTGAGAGPELSADDARRLDEDLARFR